MLLCLPLVLVLCSAAQNTIFYVATPGSGDVCSAANPCGSIRNAFSAAIAAGVTGDVVVQVGPGTYVENSPIVVNAVNDITAFTIDGGGNAKVTSTMNSNNTLLSIFADVSLTIQNLVVENLRIPFIYQNISQPGIQLLKFVQCRFSHIDFQNPFANGFIRIESSSQLSLFVSGCLFENFSVSVDDEAFVNGGAIRIKTSSLCSANVRNSNFSHINLASGNGGALSIECSASSLFELESVIFDSNFARNGGSLHSSISRFEARNISCYRSTAISNGGCFYFSAQSSTILITNSSFLNNSVLQGSGGSIYMTNIKSVDVVSSNFFSGSAFNKGGALFISSELEESNVLMHTCIFNLCSTTASDGGALFINVLGTFKTQNTEFVRTSASSGEGGAIALYGSFSSIENCSFLECEADSGGIIFATSSGFSSAQLFISDASMLNSNAISFGGAIYLSSYIHANISASKITGNHAYDGGAIYVLQQSSITISSSVITRNKADYEGGAIYFDSLKSASIVHSLLDYNEAFIGNGGAIYLVQTASAVIFRNSSCSHNSAMESGGCIYAIGASSTMRVYGAIFEFNRAGRHGGALYLARYTSSVDVEYVMENSKVGFNYAEDGSGGGLYGTGLFELSKNEVIGNIAFVSGGGMFLTEANASMCHEIITQNVVSSRGGAGIYISGYFNISNCFISSNWAQATSSNGGGMSANLIFPSYFFNCTFSANLNSGKGGALFVSSKATHLIISGSLFLNNSATEGGAIYFQNSSYMILSSFLNSIFQENKALRGGGIYFEYFIGYFNSVIFLNNSAIYDSVGCDNGPGIGGSILIHEFNCESRFENSFLNVSVFSSFASRAGGGIFFLKFFFVDRISCPSADLIYSTIKFRSNAAKYGIDLASGFYNLTSSFRNIEMYSFDVISITFSLKDFFGNAVVGDYCDIFFTIQNSTNEGLLDFWQRSLTNIRFDQQAVIRYEFIFGNPTFPPVADALIRFTLMVKISSVSISIDNAIILCQTGQALIPDSFRFWKCIDCEGGRFVDSSGMNCEECMPGYFSERRSTICSKCPAGKASAASSESCIDCAPGKFANGSAFSECINCFQGFYVEYLGAQNCSKCPMNGMTLFSGTSSNISCICLDGYFGKPSIGVNCVKCPSQEGVVCPDDSLIPFVGEGHWRSPLRVDHILDCIPKAACPLTGFTNETICASGYTGYMCGECVLLEYFRLDGKCWKCNSVPLFMWFLLAGIIGIFLLFAFKVVQNSSRIPFDIRIGISWLQIISLFTRVSNSWPSEVLFFLRVGSFINFEFELFSPACAIPIGFWSYYFSQMLAPLIFISVLVVIIGLIEVKRYHAKKSHDFFYQRFISRTIASIVFIFSNMFTFIASKVLGPLECYQQPDNSFTLVLSPSLRCYEEDWNDNYVSVIFFSFLYLGLIPALLLYVFFKYRTPEARGSVVFLARYGTLVLPYKSNLFFWELILSTKKLLFVILVKVLAGVSISLRLFYLISTLSFFILVENYFLPFKTEYLNGLNSFWNIAAIFLLLSNALVFEPEAIGYGSRILVSVLVIAVLLVAIVASISRLVFNFIFRKRYGMEHATSIAEEKHQTNTDDEDVWLGKNTFVPISVPSRRSEALELTLSLSPRMKSTTTDVRTNISPEYRTSVVDVRRRLDENQ